jgi:arylsulfatase A-like enzyme
MPANTEIFPVSRKTPLPGGYMGKILRVNLTSRSANIENLPEEPVLRKLIGGQALATYILLKELPIDATPFGPENKVVMLTGPITGTGLTPGGTKVTAVYLSPLTGHTLGRGAASGFWPVTLKAAGYATSAIVDNPNVAASLGYAKGFDVYRETWQEPSLGSETLRARAITEGGMAFLQAARPEKPFLLWLHYVNPHAPYEPPPPFDTMFAPRGGDRGPRLAVVPGYHGGIARQWARPGLDHLGDYVGLYDGEIASVDQEVGRVVDALRASAVGDRTLVVLTSDHGESLGEHDYYFDHGENVFEPSLRIPLIVVKPSSPAGQRSLAFASTLDLVPTVLDAVKVSWPPDLAGVSLLGAVEGKGAPKRGRLFAQNDRNLSASFGEKLKIVATPDGDRVRFALFDREKDPGETRDVSKERADDLRAERRELELFTEKSDREWARTRPLVEGRPAGRRLSAEDCERLKALGYVDSDCE